MVTIEVNGQQVQAYDLIMRKEHALEIIAGKKPLEIRVFSDHYCNMFSDDVLIDLNEELLKEKRNDECVDPTRQDIKYIRFHNYSKSWVLDVEIDEVGFAAMTEADIADLAERFGFHDYDNEWQKYADTPMDDVPMFFWLHIVGVVNKVGI